MARKAFTDKDDGGIASAIPHNERRGACFADGCPMPGTINLTGTQWHCGWHHQAQPSDIPRITRTINDWACVASEINRARAALIGQFASDPAALNQLFTEAVNRLRPAVMGGGWGKQFERDGFEGYRDWMIRLQDFLHARVTEATSTHRRAA